MGFDIDGKELFNSMITASAKAEGKNDIVRLSMVFSKHGLDLVEGISLMLEVLAVFESKRGDDDDG